MSDNKEEIVNNTSDVTDESTENTSETTEEITLEDVIKPKKRLQGRLLRKNLKV
jgi:hypothetical protein